MEPRVSMITLGVSDLVRSRQFYESGLGWPVSDHSNEQVVFLPLGGVVLALYPEESLAEDATVAADRTGTFRGVTLAHNTRSRDAVDEVMASAVAAGAQRIKPPQDVFWGGYCGYFADPDGHLWEVAYNPHWPLNAAGEIVLSK